ncbi:hypothetical protein PYCCODRAFT_602982 [Trametes coccinea BRFM310]|uniref:Uncharacterized protein n=1 Tax=Trametes coccinea (strain BRFM310) TaxID=1353009 RepID=A0A1Y2J594_TRAC3|nr:hypothetical protein PYCCODRAFT_602982 [Trametes coccinea BRFM310]
MLPPLIPFGIAQNVVTSVLLGTYLLSSVPRSSTLEAPCPSFPLKCCSVLAASLSVPNSNHTLLLLVATPVRQTSAFSICAASLVRPWQIGLRWRSCRKCQKVPRSELAKQHHARSSLSSTRTVTPRASHFLPLILHLCLLPRIMATPPLLVSRVRAAGAAGASTTLRGCNLRPTEAS